jgi:hypothetical protein
MNEEIELLRRLFRYEKETGKFFWRETRAGGAHRGSVRATIGDAAGKVDPSTGYVRLRSHGKKWFAHRAAWALTFGSFPVGHIDHINGIKTDNRICNLRDVDRFVNQQNRRSASSKNKSTGVLGVACRGGLYVASITVRRKRIHLGKFTSKGEAHEAYLHAKRQLHEGNTL